MNKSEKIKLIRESISQNNYPLQFKSMSLYESSNCYSYAIGSKYVEDKNADEYIYNLGCMAGLKWPRNSKEAENAFIEDMKVLGIQVKKSFFMQPLQKDEWKVALFFQFWGGLFRDFHFARQDADGEWSHQEGIALPIYQIGENPEWCTHLDLVGYYVLKKI